MICLGRNSHCWCSWECVYSVSKTSPHFAHFFSPAVLTFSQVAYSHSCHTEPKLVCKTLSFYSNFWCIVKMEGEVQRHLICLLSPYRCFFFSPLLTSGTSVVVRLLHLMNLHWHITVSQFTLVYNLDANPLHLNKCTVLCIHHYSVPQHALHCPKSLLPI